MKIELPWPDSRLSPNARKDRRGLTGVRNEAKRAGHYAAVYGGLTRDWPKTVALTITFHPPDNRKRDTDNMLASCKYMLDGVATAMGVDDQAFNPITLVRAEKREGGYVIVEIQGDNWQSIGDLAANMVRGSVT